jgi:hypothetical protein
LRKYLMATVAAVAALAVAVPAASAQGGVDLEVDLKPANAGTKRKPTSTRIHFVATNEDVSQTAERIKIWIPKTLKINTRGFKRCSVNTLSNQGPNACPNGSEVGGGTALARAGVNVNPTNPPQLPFDVRAFVSGKNGIVFHIRSTNPGIDITAVAPGKLRRASGKFGQLLDVTIPYTPAQFYLGQYNGLEQLDVTIGGKRRKNMLIASSGCRNRKAPFKTEIGFAANPGPPRAETLSDTADARCRK